MDLAPSQVAGLLIYVAVWVALLRDEWSALPLGRGVSACVGAALMVAVGTLSPAAAFASIDVPTLALLTGCMMLSAHAEKAGVARVLAAALSGVQGRALLLRISLITFVASAFFTNDTACILLTPIIVRAARASRLRPRAALICTALAANTGSACSPIGNPQNMLIALAGGLSFATFLRTILLASTLGLVVNVLVVAHVFEDDLEPRESIDGSADPASTGMVKADDTAAVAAATDSASARAAPSRTAAVPAAAALSAWAPSATSAQVTVSVTPAAADAPSVRQRAIVLGLCVTVPLLLFADAWMGLAWTSLFAGSALFVIDGVAPAPLLARIDAGLLFFFAGLFVCTSGLGATGLPAAAWAAAAPALRLDTGSGTFFLTLLVVLGANTISNVPLVLLLKPTFQAMPAAGAINAWALLAWTSTVGGNLTLLGAVANVIVAERARAEGESISAVDWMKAGVPATILSLALGTPLVWALSR